MGYITREELVGEMPLADIEAALTDGGASDMETVWTSLGESVAEEIHGLLAPRYSYPFADPVQPTVKSASRTLTLYRLYKRRGLTGDANPMKEEANAVRAHLRNIGTGKFLLDASSPQPAAPVTGPKAVTGAGSVQSQRPNRMPC